MDDPVEGGRVLVTPGWEGDSSVGVGGFVGEELGVDGVPEEFLTVNVEEIELELTSDGDGLEEFMVEGDELGVVEGNELGVELGVEELGAELGAEPAEELGTDDEDEGGEGGWMKEG